MDPPRPPIHDNSAQIQPEDVLNDNVRIAASALDDMRSSRDPSAPTLSMTPDPEPSSSVSRLPAVLNSAMNLYDYSKQNSRLVSYGANVVESSVQALSRPVLDRLPSRVLNYGRSDPSSPAPPSAAEDMQIDANPVQLESPSGPDSVRPDPSNQPPLSCSHRQLDAHREDSGEIPAAGDNDIHLEEDPMRDAHPALLHPSAMPSDPNEGPTMDSNQDRPPSVAPSVALTDASRFTARSETLASPGGMRRGMDELSASTAVSRRSPWQTIMVEAGGISAAVSDESMRKLKYCLEWLQWATANLDTQITLLETFIASINSSVTGEPIPSSATVSPEALQHYMSVKRNVVNTIRQVVEVVGKYAGGSLPEPAKQKVKGFILSLPGRWSMAVKDAGLGEGWEGSPSATAAVAPGDGPTLFSNALDPINSASGSGSGPGNGDAAVGTTTGRAGPSSGSTINPRKRNRLESSSQSLASEATTASSATITGITQSPTTSSLATSPTRTTAGPGQPGVKRGQLLPPTAGAARHAAHRVLTLAQESLHAVKGVTGVFKDTLDRAETWVDRFRRVGYSSRYAEDNERGVSRLRSPHKGTSYSPPSPGSTSSARSLQERRRMQMSARELHLEALARSIPSVGPYGPYETYGTGNTPPMSPILPPVERTTTATSSNSRQNAFPFDNPAPGAPGYGWIGGGRKSDSGLGGIPTLNLSETNRSGRSRAGSMSQYESSTSESLPPPSVIGSTSSVGGDDELEEEGEYERRRIRILPVTGVGNPAAAEGFSAHREDDDGIEYRVRKRRRKEEEVT